jgi:PAS domain S-box-containing protein
MGRPELSQGQIPINRPRPRAMRWPFANGFPGWISALQSAAVARKAFTHLRNGLGSRAWIAWTAIWAASFLGLFALAVGVWQALNLSHDDNANTSAAMYILLDTESNLEAEIARTVRPAIERTEILAKSSKIIRALASGDSVMQTALLNSQIVTATEIDAIALFNSAGRIIAINTYYANGKPIARDRVNRVLTSDFSQLGIIRGCLSDNSNTRILEFQTHCAITPAFFDSTGLSVAYSVPVISPENGVKLGVISSRLRFERLSGLIEDQTIAGGSASAYFITDAGGYFSEAINSGREQPPVPVSELREIVRPILSDPAARTATKRADKYLAIFSLPGIKTMEGGGMHILIVADGRWLTRGPRQDRLIHASEAGLIGTLLLIVAGLVYARLTAGHIRRSIEEANTANARLAAIVESSSEAIISESLDSTILSWNRGAEKTFGYTASEVIGYGADLVEPADQLGEIAKLRQAVLNGALVEQFETQRRRKDGRSIEVSLSISLIRNHKGEIMGFSRIVRDITSQKRNELELREAHDQLKTAHTKLVDAARQAGMAEVAIGVLHNVGNVLNSVNVSASIVDGKIRRSKASSLGKVVAMLKEHEADLGLFMERDGKGLEVVAYLQKLSEAITFEQKDVLTELEALSKNVEHVKEIVNRQQSYATAAALVESLNVRDLLEDALSITGMSLGRHQVNVVRNYGDTHLIYGDKHKVLQVLVNLITNAKQAMSKSEIKILTLSTETTPTGEVCVSIRDTGCGIAPGNITRIFAHGFTTKSTGHGFGLHSSILAAKEMKGRLTVRSDGLGLGATFVLELQSSIPQAIPT